MANKYKLYFRANFAYNISVKRGEPMEERLLTIVASQGGIIRTSDAVSAGISKVRLAAFLQKHGYVRASHGIYLSPDAWPDEMFLLQLRCPSIVFSHEAALYLLDLSDQEPMHLTVTAKTGYNPSHLSAEGIKTFTIKNELFHIGLTKCTTPFGHEVNAYNAERTICDLVRCRSNLDPRFLQEALKRYMSRSTRNIPLLLEYASAFHCKSYLKPYLEVLLP